MNEWTTVYALFAGLYLWECLVWARPGTEWIGAAWGIRWKAARVWAVTTPRGLFVANPLPPIGLVSSAEPWPAGFSWNDPPSKVGGEGRDVLVHDVLVHRFESEALAAQVRAAMQRGESPQQLMARRLDLDAIRERSDALHAQAQWLRFMGTMLLSVGFVVLPTSLVHYGHHWPTKVAAGAFLLLWWGCAVGYFRAHGSLYGDGGGGRANHTFVAFVLPTAAMRVADTLSRPAFENFEPLAIWLALTDRDDAIEKAARHLRDLRFPWGGGDPMDSEERRWHLQAVEEFLAAQGVDADGLLPAPADAKAEGNRYCPRCLEVYRVDGGTCEACGGVVLR